MRRKIIAVIIGFVISSVAMVLVLTQARFKGFWWHLIGFGNTYIPNYYLPALLGGFISGYLARQRGWLCGFIVGVLLTTVGTVTKSVNFWTLYQTPDIVEITTNTILFLWTSGFWITLVISGMAGGLLGQLLAQKWHKRSHKKSDASQSESN